ncbi:MAG: prepilin-type N-terminal cleavage/methylation domain-containing protein [Planctomycetes bacterium]|nr:prepilin-type N-terminal cleavage/methylation domain-containing protein [Planctomycetota bacterium]
MSQRKNRRGFTLVELMVVIVILGIIGTMAFVFVLDKPDKAKWTKAQTEMGEIQKALNTYALENDSTYPESLSEIEGEGKPFPNGTPKDPFSKDDYIYEVTDSGFTLTCLGKDLAEGGAEVPDKDIVFTEAGQMTEQ